MQKNQNSKLILFVSIDIVGSTDYKNKETRDGDMPYHPWLSFFIAFNEEFDLYITNAAISIHEKLSDSDKSKLEINDISLDKWKSAGDEMLMYKRISDIHQAYGIILSVRKAIEDYTNSQIKKKNLPLALKATAWIAGFPVINAEITTYHKEEKIEDFIGPTIDIGFRLTQFASTYKFIISLELAYMLSCSADSAEYEELLRGIYYDGDSELKGVLSGRPYPVFWIDTFSEIDELKMKMKKKEKCSSDDIKKLCELFIDGINNNYLITLPYIRNDSEIVFGEMPESHRQIIGIIEKQNERSYEKNPGRSTEYSSRNKNELYKTKIKIAKKNDYE